MKLALRASEIFAFGKCEILNGKPFNVKYPAVAGCDIYLRTLEPSGPLATRCKNAKICIFYIIVTHIMIKPWYNLSRKLSENRFCGGRKEDHEYQV